MSFVDDLYQQNTPEAQKRRAAIQQANTRNQIEYTVKNHIASHFNDHRFEGIYGPQYDGPATLWAISEREARQPRPGFSGGLSENAFADFDLPAFLKELEAMLQRLGAQDVTVRLYDTRPRPGLFGRPKSKPTDTPLNLFLKFRW